MSELNIPVKLNGRIIGWTSSENPNHIKFVDEESRKMVEEQLSRPIGISSRKIGETSENGDDDKNNTNKHKKPTIQVNLWEYHTLFKRITIPAFVTLPGILIIDDEYYSFADHSDSRNSAGGINYIKATAYKVENLLKQSKDE